MESRSGLSVTAPMGAQLRVSPDQLPDFGLHVLDARPIRLAFLCRRQEDSCRRFQQLRLPLRDLVGVNIELLRQFCQCLVALQCGYRDFRLERGGVVPSRSSHCCSFSGRLRRPSEQSLHLSTSTNFRDHL